MWGAVLPGVSLALGVGDRQLGLALICVAAGALPAMLLAGYLADRAGLRLLAPAVAIFGVCAALPGFAPNVVWLGVSLLAVGVASGGLDVVMNAAADAGRGGAWAARHAPRTRDLLRQPARVERLRRPRPRCRPLLRDMLLWIGAAAILAMAALVGGLSSADAPPRPRSSARSRECRSPTSRSSPSGSGRSARSAYLVENGLQLWSAQHLERTLGSSPAISGLGPGIFAASAVAGRLAGQLWAARLGERRLLILAGVGAALGAVIFAFAPDWPIALAGLALAGGAISVSAPTLFALAGRMADPNRRGAAVSGVAILGYLGFLIGPAMLGAISGTLGLRGAIIAIGMVAIVFAVASAVSLQRLGTAR